MNRLKSLWLGLMVTLLIVSCEDTGIEPTNNLTDNNSTQLKNASFDAQQVRSSLSSLGIGGAFSAAFAQSSASTGGSSAGRTASSSNAKSKGTSCFTETFTEYDDGSYTWIIEFSGNCSEEEDELLSGIIRGSGKYSENGFVDTLIFENFGSQYWTVSGSEIIEGTFQFEEDEPADDEEEWEEISATYSFILSLSIEEKNDEGTYQYQYESNGKESYNENQFVVEEYKEKSTSTNEVFEGEVTSPLVIDFNCEVSEEFWIPVSGSEVNQWTFEGVTETETIDFGEGTCDAMATITSESGTEEINLLDEDEDEDEESDDDDDGDEEDGEDGEDGN